MQPMTAAPRAIDFSATRRRAARLIFLLLLCMAYEDALGPSANMVELTVDPASVSVGETATVSVQLRDQNGRPVKAGKIPLTLSSTHGRSIARPLRQ
ncbi:MAG: hypothetical protein ACT4O1_02005 [Gemmatimonadota bacterium]